MTTSLFPQFADAIRSLDDHSLDRPVTAEPSFLLRRNGSITVEYAPFDHVNTAAKMVIIGITPGRTQARNALGKARDVLRAGGSLVEAERAAKTYASFSGPMRHNLVSMLDFLGLDRVLGVPSCATFWEERSDLVHFTSFLRYPVFVDGRNYGGTSPALGTPFLMDMAKQWLLEELRAMPKAVLVPLGPKGGVALSKLLVSEGLSTERLLWGLPHPSGANAERIAYFRGRKPRALLSTKTNAERIDTDRARARGVVASL